MDKRVPDYIWRARSFWENVWSSLIVRNFYLILKLEFISAKKILYNNSKIENVGDNILEKIWA